MKNQSDNEARRAYWTAKMEEAFEFMGHIRLYPVEECGEPMVTMADAAADAGVEVIFSELPHVQGLPRHYLLRAGLMNDFIHCARAMNECGWIMRVEDAFRTMKIQKFLARAPHTFDVVLERLLWECDGAQPNVEFVIRRVGALVASAPKVGTHMSGSAIDISVLDRLSGREIDRGCPYLELSELTPMDSPFISDEARANRAAITALMGRHGFVTYPWEFWHYSKGDAYDHYLNQSGHTARYGAVHVTVTDGSVEAIAAPLTPLNSNAEIESEMRAAKRRNEQKK